MFFSNLVKCSENRPLGHTKITDFETILYSFSNRLQYFTFTFLAKLKLYIAMMRLTIGKPNVL